MYSPEIISRRLHAARARGLTILDLSVEESIARSRVLEDRFARMTEAGSLRPGQWPLSADEMQFVRSELLRCRVDFRYWASRWGFREIEGSQGGGHGVSTFWPSQERALKLLADREEVCHAEVRKYGMTQGILGVWNKTRQQGATALLRLLMGHRMVTRPHQRAIAASLDETRKAVLYQRDKIWLDNQPFWLRPAVLYDVKEESLVFDNATGTGMKSSVLYQMASQKGGIGVGQQFDLAHFTEVSKWKTPGASRGTSCRQFPRRSRRWWAGSPRRGAGGKGTSGTW